MIPHPLAFLALAVAATPAVFLASAVVTTWWYERYWLPRICGED